MSYAFYKLLHMTGLILTFFSFGLLFLGFAYKESFHKSHRLLGFIGHGLGLFLLLLSGFGMAARLNIVSEFPAWMLAKIGIWLLLGLSIAALKRLPKQRNAVLGLIFALGFSAIYLVVNKPI